jgi:hypothetical protein
MQKPTPTEIINKISKNIHEAGFYTPNFLPIARQLNADIRDLKELAQRTEMAEGMCEDMYLYLTHLEKDPTLIDKAHIQTLCCAYRAFFLK